jgi:glutathione S-transferase
LNKTGAPSAQEIESAVPKCAEAFAVLDAHLAGKLFMLGDTFTMADVTPAIQANRLVGNSGFGFESLAPSNFPNVVAWHTRLCERPAFQEQVMTRFT